MEAAFGCAHDVVKQRPTFELADILRRYLPDYLKTHRISFWQKKILYAIQVAQLLVVDTWKNAIRATTANRRTIPVVIATVRNARASNGANGWRTG